MSEQQPPIDPSSVADPAPGRLDAVQDRIAEAKQAAAAIPDARGLDLTGATQDETGEQPGGAFEPIGDAASEVGRNPSEGADADAPGEIDPD